MRGEKTEIAKAELFDGVVRYSRIDANEPSDDPEERAAPMFVGVEVPQIQEPDSRRSRAAPEVRPPVDGNGRGRRRRSFGLFFAVAIVAFLTGIGVLAGSFYYLTVAKVKRPVVAAQATPDVAFLPVSGAAQTLSGATAAEKPAALPASPGASGDAGQQDGTVAPDFSAASESASPLVVSVEPAGKPTVEAPAAKIPVPRTRPETSGAEAASAAERPIAKPNAEPKLRPGKSEQGPAIVRMEPAPAEVPPVPAPSAEDPLTPPAGNADDVTADQAAGDPQSIVPDSGETVPVPPADIPEAPDVIAPSPQQQVIISAAPADGSLEEPQSGAVAVPGEEGAGVAPGPNGAIATEGGDDPYQSALDNWRVLSVRNGVAVIDGRERGIFMVQRGSEIPGVGIVEAIKKHRGRWTVVTSVGFIVSAAVDDHWRPLRFLERRRFLTR